MKRLLKLPRKKRDIIGGLTVGVGFVVNFLIWGPDGVLIAMIPFVIFFAWLCPETWGGK